MEFLYGEFSDNDVSIVNGKSFWVSFSNQVDGLHQQIVIEILVHLQQKVEADFAKGKGNDQSG